MAIPPPDQSGARVHSSTTDAAVPPTGERLPAGSHVGDNRRADHQGNHRLDHTVQWQELRAMGRGDASRLRTRGQGAASREGLLRRSGPHHPDGGPASGLVPRCPHRTRIQADDPQRRPRSVPPLECSPRDAWLREQEQDRGHRPPADQQRHVRTSNQPAGLPRHPDGSHVRAAETKSHLRRDHVGGDHGWNTAPVCLPEGTGASPRRILRGEDQNAAQDAGPSTIVATTGLDFEGLRSDN